MSAKTTKPGALALPLYASKPQRTVTDTGVIAVTMYSSTDRSVRHYAFFDKDGNPLGMASNHMARRGGVVAGYHLGTGSYLVTRGQRHFDNLAEVGAYLLANKEA